MIRPPKQYSKNKKERLMPVIGTIAEVLERRQAKRRINCDFVFHRDGRPIKFFNDSFKAAAKKIGATGTLPHDMRRSAVRNFRRSGLSEQEGMALSRHQTSSIYRRYSIISEEDLIESMKRVEEHLKAEKQKTARLCRSNKGAHERGEKFSNISSTIEGKGTVNPRLICFNSKSA
jgi:integrase